MLCLMQNQKLFLPNLSGKPTEMFAVILISFDRFRDIP